MEINPVNTQGAASTSMTGLAEDFDTFLLLLTEQLQNQDPLDPMDTNEFTSQLVEFTSVEQAIATNQNLETLIGLQSQSATSTALGYLGREVTARGSTTGLVNGEAVWNYRLAGSADTTTLTLTDASGRVVFTGPGQTQSGEHSFVWDGTDNAGDPLPEGAYTLTVDANDPTGSPISTTIEVTGTISGVTNQGTDPVLQIGEAILSLNDITEVRLPSPSDQQNS